MLHVVPIHVKNAIAEAFEYLRTLAKDKNGPVGTVLYTRYDSINVVLVPKYDVKFLGECRISSHETPLRSCCLSSVLVVPHPYRAQVGGDCGAS
jgi:hypothetical protein